MDVDVKQTKKKAQLSDKEVKELIERSQAGDQELMAL